MNKVSLAKRLPPRWKFYAAIVIVLGSLAGYNLAITTMLNNAGDAAVVEDPTMEHPDYILNAEDSVDVQFKVTSIDPIREFIKVEYEIDPYGIWGMKNLESGESQIGSAAYIARPFVLQYDSSGQDRDPNSGILSTIALKSGTWVGGFQAPITLHPCSNINGTNDESRSSKSYPSDMYCFDITMNTLPASKPLAQGYPTTWLTNTSNGIDGYKITLRRVPYFFDVQKNECQQYAIKNDFSCTIEDDAYSGYSRVQGMIERAQVSQIFTWFVLGMIILAAVCAVAMTIAVVTGSRPPALEGLAFLAALLFAVQPLRGALPDAPPIGIDLDVRVFYVCILAILACLAINVATWIRRDDYKA
jgi:hypothetical protein